MFRRLLTKDAEIQALIDENIRLQKRLEALEVSQEEVTRLGRIASNLMTVADKNVELSSAMSTELSRLRRTR